MTVSCPDCRSVFRVDPAKVPATGVRARCSVCGGVIAIAGGTLPISVTPASTSAVAASRSMPTPQRPYTPAGGVPAAAGMMTPPAPSRAPATPLRRPTPAAVAGTSNAPGIGAPTPAAPVAALESTTVAASATMLGNGATAVSAAPAASAASPVKSAPAGSATVATVAMPTPRRSINPFLNADPGQRARRLARALVSDLVAYHPQKREEGLRDGSLRQLFREDIKKSYEEYVEQVGRDVAEGSPHFQEALNEILGGGRKLF